MKLVTATIAVLTLGAALLARGEGNPVVEPRSGVAFAAQEDDASLLGVGLRTRTFLKVKVYAIGLYVSDQALRSALASYKGKTGGPAFYAELVNGDFARHVRLKFVRDVGQDAIRDAMREALAGADRTRLEAFVAYFPEVKTGQECVLRYTPGGVLETTMAGQARPAIADKAFASRVFGIWLGERPLQDDIKKDLVSRASTLLP